jgi:hypothetical protein
VSVPLPNKMDQEIASVINRALFQQLAQAHIRIMNARRNAKGTITAITEPERASGEDSAVPRHHDYCRKDCQKAVVDVKGNESVDRLKIHAVPLVRFMGKYTEGLQK